MKRYEAPEFEVLKYNDEDVLLVSEHDNFSVTLDNMQ